MAQVWHSIHDLRHTCAVETYYAWLRLLDDRLQALAKVRAQLGHKDIATTEEMYAVMTEQYSSWLSFSEGLDIERRVQAGQDSQ